MTEEKKLILKKIKSGELFLKRFDAKEKKSEIWSCFCLVVNTDGKSQNFVQCEKCKLLFKYESSKTGTSHLKRHKCYDKLDDSQRKISEFSQIKQPVVFSAKIKEQLIKDSIFFCSKDIRPFEIIKGLGFKKLCQSLIQIGAQYGNIKVDDILPHPTTISRHLIETAECIRQKLLPEISAVMELGICAATTDMWTDDYKKIPYITLTIQFIDNRWVLNTKVLFTCSFPNEDKKTGDNIRRELIKRFSNFGLDINLFKKLNFVTDQGANIVSALSRYERFNCSAHLFNTVLRNTFENNFLAQEDLEIIKTTMDNCKSLVMFMKQSGYMNLLPKSIYQEVETRWNTRLLMILSVDDQFEHIQEILTSKEEDHRLSEIDRNLLSGLIIFLKPFKECSDMLERDKKPTFHFVTLCYFKLLKHLRTTDYEFECLNRLKQRAEEFLIKKFVLTDEHKFATFLCPKFRQLKMLTESERLDVIKKLKIMVQEIQEYPQNNATPIPFDGQDRPENYVPPRKKSAFSEWEDDDPNLPTSSKSQEEIELYIKTETCIDLEEDILTWWKSHSDNFPVLSKLAQKYLGNESNNIFVYIYNAMILLSITGIPATSASSERNFSTAGRVLEERRTSLKTENVDALLFLNSNI